MLFHKKALERLFQLLGTGFRDETRSARSGDHSFQQFKLTPQFTLNSAWKQQAVRNSSKIIHESRRGFDHRGIVSDEHDQGKWTTKFPPTRISVPATRTSGEKLRARFIFATISKSKSISRSIRQSGCRGGRVGHASAVAASTSLIKRTSPVDSNALTTRTIALRSPIGF